MKKHHFFSQRGNKIVERLIYFLILYSGPLLIHADGSSDPRFKYCVGICEGKSTEYLDSLLCPNIDPNEMGLYDPHFPTMDAFCRFFGWTLNDDCIYHCAHRLADPDYYSNPPFTHISDSFNVNPTMKKSTFFENKAEIKQYYGKWPLFRVLGMQEFFSVIFSAMNLGAHLLGFGYFSKKTKIVYNYRIPLENNRQFCYFYWFPSIAIYFGFACFTWIASMIYHVRQTNFTLGLDYFFSMGFLVLALALTVIRVLRIKSLKKQALVVYFPVVVFLSSYGILMMTVDITKYHIYVGMFVSVFFVLLWLFWAVKYYFKGRRDELEKKPHLPLILIFLFLLVLVTGCLGIFDFVPLGLLLDAHSLWHLSTVFLTLLMYVFLSREACDELSRYNSSVFLHLSGDTTVNDTESSSEVKEGFIKVV